MSARTETSDPPDGPDYLRRLRNVRGVRRELARLFGEARTGKIDWSDASRGANILQILSRLIEGSDFEQRLDTLEAVVAERHTRPNGADHAHL